MSICPSPTGGKGAGVGKGVGAGDGVGSGSLGCVTPISGMPVLAPLGTAPPT